MPGTTETNPSLSEARASELRTVLITGAAGYLGGLLRVGLRNRFRLHLTDRAELPTPPSGSEDFRSAALEDRARLESLMDGVDAVVHLGGSVVLEQPWENLLSANIDGTYNVFESARRCGVRRVVYASSHHVVGFYRRDRKIGVTEPMRPDSRYAVSKAFGETLGRLYADKYGMSVICQRIGVTRPLPPHRRSLSNWMSERDYVELTRCCLEAKAVTFQIVYGVSDNSVGFYDTAAAASIGFTPRDSADGYRADVLERNPDPEPSVDALFQGGSYCSTELDNDPNRINSEDTSFRK